jgi:hypothetical protein
MCVISPDSVLPIASELLAPPRTPPVCVLLPLTDMESAPTLLRERMVNDGPMKQVAAEPSSWKITTVKGPLTSVVTAFHPLESANPGLEASFA